MSADLEHKALPIPDRIEDGDQVLELARVWWTGNGPIMNVRPALNDPANVGIVLAEMAWIYAQAYAEHRGLDQAEAFHAIGDAWTRAHAQAAAGAAAAKESAQ